MKIKSINASESNSHSLAFNTEPEMSLLILEGIRLEWANDATLKDFIPSLSQGHILKLNSPRPISLNTPAHLVPALEKVLSAAEQSIAVKSTSENKGDGLLRLNGEILREVSKNLGIPIE